MQINDKILERLEEWQQKEGSLPEIVGFYRDLLRIQAGARIRATAAQPGVSKAEIAARMQQGIPLLKWDALSIDWPVFQDLFRAAVTAVSEHTCSPSESLRDIASEISLLQEVTRAWYEGASLLPWTDRYGVNEELLAMPIHCAIKPFLAAQAEALIALVPQEQWRRGYCPVCGGKPDFAFLDRERGARWLLCSRCDTEWLFQRLQCPYCDTQDQKALSYFTDESEVYRLYVCQRCRSYLKAIDLRRSESEVLPPLERVLTADMDRQGEERGYRGGWVSPAPDGRQ